MLNKKKNRYNFLKTKIKINSYTRFNNKKVKKKKSAIVIILIIYHLNYGIFYELIHEEN